MLTKSELIDYSPFFKSKDTSYINLNNGTLGLCPDSVIESQIQYLKSFESNTSENLGMSWKKMGEIQKQVSDFFNIPFSDLILRPNVTLVLNDFIRGVTLPSRSSIWTNNLEYGAINNILKLKCRQEDLEYLETDMASFLDQEENLTEEDLIHFVLKTLKQNTKLVLISHVLTGNGLVFPINKLGKELRSRGILMIVDGAHAPGLIPLNFRENLTQVDFYGGNLHKWFMGPKGTAFGFAHQVAQKHLKLIYGSWTSEEITPDVFQYFDENCSFARQWLWSHSQSFPSYFALSNILQFWKQHNSDVIYNQIYLRFKKLEQQLEHLRFKQELANHPRLTKVFVSYDISNCEYKFHHLKIKGESNVQVGLPHLSTKKIMRLSPHIHNTEEEILKASNVILKSIY